MPNVMPRIVRGTSRLPITGTCQTWRSRSSPGRVHSTPQPVQVAAADVTRREAGRGVAFGVTVFWDAGAEATAFADAAPLVVCAEVVPGEPPGPPGAPSHAGCEPEGLAAGAGCGCSFATGGDCLAAGRCCLAGDGCGGFAGAGGGAARFGSWMIDGRGAGAGVAFGAAAGAALARGAGAAAGIA